MLVNMKARPFIKRSTDILRKHILCSKSSSSLQPCLTQFSLLAIGDPLNKGLFWHQDLGICSFICLECTSHGALNGCLLLIIQVATQMPPSQGNLAQLYIKQPPSLNFSLQHSSILTFPSVLLSKNCLIYAFAYKVTHSYSTVSPGLEYACIC